MAQDRIPPHLADLFKAAGYDLKKETPSSEIVGIAENFLRRAATQPHSLVIDALSWMRLEAAARSDCAKAAAAAGELHEILSQLLEADVLLGRLVSLDAGPQDAEGPARAVCRVGGQLRELPVHPDAALEDFKDLAPWDYVAVNAKAMAVVGVLRRAEFFALAHGEVVEFKGYLDGTRDLARVMHAGHAERIVTLPPAVRGRELAAGTKLVLHRDDDACAIAALSADSASSRFEVPIEEIHTRLEDLAGLDPVIERLIEDTLKRVVHPQIREEFNEEPLGGLLLYSYKPGMGKTALARAFSRWLYETGQEHGFDVVLHVVPPNALKSMWHGGDARLVREDLCGSIRARLALPRQRPLILVVVMDEVDCLGKRAGGDDTHGYLSPAQNDAVQSLLPEMDGMRKQETEAGKPPAHVLWFGMTTRPDMVDDALKRPGRFGDLFLAMPDLTVEAAEAILAIYARGPKLPWYLDGEVRRGLEPEEVRERFLQPALAEVFDTVVLRFTAEVRAGRPAEVTAGEVMAGVHLEAAMQSAKRLASRRRLLGVGVPAIGIEDVFAGLSEQALGAARQMEADHGMLRRQLRLKVPVARVELVGAEEFTSPRFLKLESA